MNTKALLSSAVIVPALLLAACASAQTPRLEFPSPSPLSTLKQRVGLTDIEIVYSRPSARGRPIFGGLLPYGKVWRTGANEATTFVTSGDVVVGGKTIPAGSYTLFTVPNKDKWTLIINKKTGEWGIPYKYEGDELARVDMKVSKLDSPVEDFTISYEKSGNGCTMQIKWEQTVASLHITAK